MGYVVSRIHELKAELAAMPEVDPATREVSKLEAIRQLAPEIALLQRKGYRLDQVVGFLTERGFAMTVGTLKTYLSRLKPRRPRQRTGDTKSTAGKPPQNRPESAAEDQGSRDVDVSASPVNAASEPAAPAPRDTPNAAVGSESSEAVKAGAGGVNAAVGPVHADATAAAAQPTAPRQQAVSAAAAAGRGPRATPGTATSKASFAPREDSDEI
jgi:hypothetical protein